MSRCRAMACAGVLLLAAGCAPLSFLLPGGNPIAYRQVVAGSVAAVEAKIRDGLADAGITVASQPSDQGVRMAGQTRSGVVFLLLLHRLKGKEGEQTEVVLEWDPQTRQTDEGFRQTLVKILNPPAEDEAGEDGADDSTP